jgi:3-oxoacyl-[acyl-carrier-protein] synthase-1
VSSIGADAAEVTASLRDAKSGITFSPDFAEHGFKCQVWGKPDLDPTDLVDRRAMRFLSQGGAWNHVAMKQAIADAGLEEADYQQNERVGIIMGSGGPSTKQIVEAADIVRQNNSPKRIGPFAVPKAMSSTASATLATWFKLHGVNYSISSACSTSAQHRQCLRDDSVGQAGHGLCRRPRRSRLDDVQPLRRHGRHVIEV